INLSYIGRKPSASPAIGSEKGHGKEQTALLDAAIAPLPAGASKDGKADDKSKSGPAAKR
ncbi:MAG: hypothetical protein ACK5P8_03990, partial [Phycisphaerae bacterium]